MPGIAKYVHPTHGLRATKHHKNTKPFAYPAAASGEAYSASQFSKDYFLAADPSQFSPNSGVVFEGPRKKQPLTGSSSNVDSVPAVFQQYLNSRHQQGGDGPGMSTLPPSL
ncbi:hypothetical protein CEXT_227381 [Caerostris extrusa]|uniref:Uncharacterized protein n=1 Tax=Caerostris extrusa TaxID=172846 RepID=A0AAV4NQC5_CAEEX|nr:hypothetical protein CEXT_227381 [Caerostris extrusa]